MPAKDPGIRNGLSARVSAGAQLELPGKPHPAREGRGPTRWAIAGRAVPGFADIAEYLRDAPDWLNPA